MAHRIIHMREQLYDLLTNKYKTPGDWSHVTNQIGMFSYTGLNGRWRLDPDRCVHKTEPWELYIAAQCKDLIEKAHIYLTSNGRISMAGLNSHNVDYVAQCIDKVVRGQL
jgi:aspartate aminotransferase